MNLPQEVSIVVGDETLCGFLEMREDARGLVVFVHGSGSSRLSPRNRAVAKCLTDGGLGTLLFDLLTPEEEELDMRTAELRFDIDFLSERLAQVTDWVFQHVGRGRPRIGYFGSSTGAAAALAAATLFPEQIHAVVSRGGRPDLAGDRLADVQAPTLLLVGGRDIQVLELNRQALSELNCEKELRIIPGATHLFEEPGTLTQVATLARDWFVTHLADRVRNCGPQFENLEEGTS
jgi:dienelactone hydrolase